MTWNPYFLQKENVQLWENAVPKRVDEPPRQNPTKKLQIQEPTKYKRNAKQNSCIPFQINIPQQSSKQLTKVAQQALKPALNRVLRHNTPQDLKDSAVWERRDHTKEQQKETNITFEQFLKEQNQSKNNSVDQKRQNFKKNTRQFSHLVEGTAYNQNTTTQNTSQYSTTDNNSNRGNADPQLSDRTMKKDTPLNSLIKHKKNTRCISMGDQYQVQLQQLQFVQKLECHEEINIEESKVVDQLGFTQETIQNLMLSELEYAPDPNYLSFQNSLNFYMRAILLDWMMEVCTEFKMKRETYYLAVCYVDKYLSLQVTSKTELQLLGTSCMFLASKMEEIQPARAEDFSKSTNDGYTADQIKDMELRVCKVLKWHLNPPTPYMWLNYYTQQWDQFVRDNSKKFKLSVEKSYLLFRQLAAYLDCAYLDYSTLQFKSRTLIASLMFLVLAVEYQQITRLDILEVIPFTSSFLMVDQQKPFNKLFSEFVQFSVGFNLVDLLPVIQYSAQFFNLETNIKVPLLSDPRIKNNYEDFVSTQSHNESQLECVRKKYRI